jgi:nitronate monooxygenase
VEEVRPKVVSFHFGLPADALLARVKATGARILCSATTVREARFLADRGVDAIIAQGAEAGGHRGMFLAEDGASQVGTMALVPQVVDAVDLPVIAAGGIADGRGIAAAFALGASGVQMGTAFLQTPEAETSELYREALRSARDEDTLLTNVFSGRPARGLKNRFIEAVGPMSPDAPAFPLAGGLVGPLRSQAEGSGSRDFSSIWAGQGAPLGRAMPAGELTLKLAEDALACLAGLAG